MKTCKRCGEEKDEHEFSISTCGRTGREYFRNMCTKCELTKQKERSYDRHLERKYGINRAQYDLIRKSQDNKCKICGEEFDGNINVDHDHKTMVIRGLLCQDCNRGLGGFRDNPVYLTKAIDYLKNTKKH